MPRVVFVCLHGAAKSVVAAAHLRRLAGLELSGIVGRHLDPDAGAAGDDRLAELEVGAGELDDVEVLRVLEPADQGPARRFE